MGKADKGKARGKKDQLRHNPLHVDIINDSPYAHSLAVSAMAGAGASAPKQAPAKASMASVSAKSSRNAEMDDNVMDSSQTTLVDSKTSQKILDIAREQQMEEAALSVSDAAALKPKQRKPVAAAAVRAQFKFGAKKTDDAEDDEDVVPENDPDFDPDSAYEANLDIDEADAELIAKYMAREPRKQVNLADLIMNKLSEAAAAPLQEKKLDPEQERIMLENQYKDSSNLDPKIIEVYSKVGVILSRYRSGKLPKAFKIIPSLPNWEQVLYITNPSGWTPHATYQATRIFVSNLQARMAQRFFNLFLLERVRDDIAETKKLNYHLYLALKKSLYKPAAFFKGLLLPLCESGTCTLREAAIIGSVITKVSIPILDSAAAILKIAEMEYSGPNSLFIRILLDKKYALPYKVLDALVFHFLRFKSEHGEEAHMVLPVLWHQSLLVFAQRYKGELVPEQKEALLDLIKTRSHPMITPEIRREIVNSKCRGELMDLDMMEA
ncbi:hypothetical protein HDU80_008844 [Chytriomyces hyalinus]|nr:hypothetical protein HDU80_008844 [Chytriomyces hyalinus]